MLWQVHQRQVSAHPKRQRAEAQRNQVEPPISSNHARRNLRCRAPQRYSPDECSGVRAGLVAGADHDRPPASHRISEKPGKVPSASVRRIFTGIQQRLLCDAASQAELDGTPASIAAYGDGAEKGHRNCVSRPALASPDHRALPLVLGRKRLELIGKAEQGGKIMRGAGENCRSAAALGDRLERRLGMAGDQLLNAVAHAAIAELSAGQCAVQRLGPLDRWLDQFARRDRPARLVESIERGCEKPDTH